MWWWVVDVDDNPVERNRAIAICDRVEFPQLALPRGCNQSGCTTTRQFDHLSDSKDSLDAQ